MAIITNKEEVKDLREAGRRLAEILYAIVALVAPGAKTRDLDARAEELIRAGGDTPAFLHYTPEGATRPYPATLCVSVNEEVVHGIPNEDTEKLLKDGDIVGLDLGLVHKGMVVDMAVTAGVGMIDKVSQKLLDTTQEALAVAIKAARAGNYVGDIGYAIETFVRKHGYGIIEELGGHGVGRAVHEDPYIPNFGTRGEGERLTSGMVLALEPMLTLGGSDVVLGKDGYTFLTRDGKRSAHFEHTILIHEDTTEIITKRA